MDAAYPDLNRWLREGVTVPGATTAHLRFSTTSAADGGAYACQAFNRWGTATSQPALLEVDDVGGEPFFVEHPRSGCCAACSGECTT